MSSLRILVVAAVLALAPAAVCTPAAAKSRTAAAAAQETADSAVVRDAMVAYSKEGFSALEKALPKLRQVLDRAPAAYAPIEERDGVLIVRVDDPSMMGRTGEAESAGRRIPARVELNTYPLAALLIGSYAVEKRRPDEALPPLDRGLALQPASAMLVSEKAMALGLLNRRQEAVDVVERWLRDVPNGSAPDRARMLRSKGFNLIELKRLDEAEAAFRESLKLEPDHALARNELDYIRELRAGGGQRRTETVTSDKAATGERAPN